VLGQNRNLIDLNKRNLSGGYAMKVNVHLPQDSKMEEFQNRICRALSRALIDTLKPQDIDYIIAKLEEENEKLAKDYKS
jgi:hypothetical protein